MKATKGLRRRAARRLMVLLGGAALYQASGCQITNANELVSTWLASVAGTFVTSFVNDYFNVPSSGAF